MDDVSGSTDETIVETNVTTDIGDPDTPTPGTVLGRYVVIRELGRGGMGLVLLAYDPTLHREVALKVVRASSKDAEARLVREARAMARMNHPNVVAVYDATVSDDSPRGPRARRVVLAMEYVRGKTLGDWLASTDRTPDEIVSHFVEAGRGLAAAHREGLLHRDFKPANVLVGDMGGHGDFVKRIARVDTSMQSHEDDDDESRGSAVAGEDTDGRLTQTGLAVGTPRYMAPEQHRSRALTPAVDQFAFCVALYEALVGQPPFSGTGSALVRAKLEGPRPWPRDSDVPSRVVQAVTRGLSPQPDARFPSLDDLLAQLERPRTSARGAWVVAAALVVSATVWATTSGDAPEPPCQGAQQHLAGVWDETRREQVRASVLGTAAAFAPDAWSDIDAGLSEWAAEWTAGHKAACEATQRGEQSEDLLDLRNACLDSARVQLSAAVDVIEGATPDVLARGHRVVDALPRLADCADLEALRRGTQRPAPQDRLAVAAARRQLARANAQLNAGQYEAASATLRDTPGLLGGVDYVPVDIEILLVRGAIQVRHAQYTEAEASLREAQRLAAREQDWRAVLKASTRLIWLLGTQLGRPEAALAFRELALGAAEGDAEATARVRAAVASTLHHQGELEAAEAEFRTAVALLSKARGAQDAVVARLRNNLGTLLETRGKYEEASAEYEAAIAATEATLGQNHPDIATWRNNLAGTLLNQSRPAEAATQYRRSIAQMGLSMGAEHPSVLSARVNLASALNADDKSAEAIEILRAVLPSLTEQLGPTHRAVLIARDTLAVTLRTHGEPSAAETEHRRALSDILAAFGPEHPEVAITRGQLAVDLIDQGKLDEAQTQLRTALELRLRSSDPTHPEVGRLHENLGSTLLLTQRPKEAVAEFRAALEIWSAAAEGTGQTHVARVHEGLAEALDAVGNHAEAAEHRRAANAVAGPEG